MTEREQAAALVRQMKLEEKASLCSGLDFWHTKPVERLALPSIMMTDGPHGLRKQEDCSDAVGATGSLPATCFPAACATACSFDRALLKEMGRAIGEECRENAVAVVLGPGINIKRSPLCGRSFEYFSEDPCLAGELAAAYIEGVQSQDVGCSLKHFALNNQETRRLSIEAVADERAAREIYLAGFERAVKKARPWTLMCSYNRLYGHFASECGWLLNEVLRDEWGFTGLVVSDWGAVNDRVAGVAAGLDLEMPGVSRENDRLIENAVQSGALSAEALDSAAARVTELILKAQRRKPLSGTAEAHHTLAGRIALESAVLLKNDGILPGGAEQRAALIGAFARTPRYQGAGSSKINPTRIDCLYDELKTRGLRFDYAPGYALDAREPDEALIGEACRAAEGKDIVYLLAGLPDAFESEGFDRGSLAMPKAHTELIRRVAAVNPRLVVVLQCGAVVDMEWEGCARAVLLAYLGGQAGAGAIAKLLLGEASPCGKLAESWPLRLEDNPAFAHFPGGSLTVEYRESIFVGYRYYDTAGLPLRYPFGHGLSYTEFQYENPRLEGFSLSFELINTGARAGAEIVQLYVAPPKSAIYKAAQELKGFEKAFLEPGERKRLSFTLTERDFAFYDTRAGAWRVEAGEYELRLAASSRDIRLRLPVSVPESPGFDTPVPDYRESAPCYYDLTKGLTVSDAAFEAVCGAPPPPANRLPGEPHTVNSTFADIEDRPFGRFVARTARRVGRRMFAGDGDMRLMLENMLGNMPLRSLLMLGGGRVGHAALEGLVCMINGHFFRGLGRILKGKRA
ncbi:MAG: glycoside hydrolase family 3 C-terminal domain-containing protein [Clostridia bacterium]|nr:glycoside hydrolase family 3 C-terminal domain-containing protein [Clostridia bacterium]